MPDYRKMYLLMFNAATDALDALENLNIGTAADLLVDAQKKAETIYCSTYLDDYNDYFGDDDEKKEIPF